MTKRPVSLVNENGEVIKTFLSVSDAAEGLGISRCALISRIKRGSIHNNCRLEYYSEWKPKGTENERNLWRARYRRSKLQIKEPKVEVKSNDNLTIDEVKNIEAKFKAENVTLERVPYEMKYGCVGITICRKFEFGKRPMIGTLRCACCTYYRGKCKSKNFVLCAHRSYNTSERLLHKKGEKED